jgi:hypothetical protein
MSDRGRAPGGSRFDVGGGDDVDDLRAWRWQSYLDHLEDLGYDLGNGQGPEDGLDPGAASRAGSSGPDGADAPVSPVLR